MDRFGDDQVVDTKQGTEGALKRSFSEAEKPNRSAWGPVSVIEKCAVVLCCQSMIDVHA